MGFFEKLKAGLSKTKNAVMGKIDGVLKSFVRVDEDLLDELEEILYCSDMGAETTEEVIESLRERIKDGRLKEPEDVKAALKQSLASVQAAQAEMMRDTKVFVKDAIAATEGMRKYEGWVPMMKRQIATAQLQLHWMVKEFDKVDKLMPLALIFDPQMASIKMARMQMKDEPVEEIRKVYDKAVRRLRYNQNVLPAALFSWILVKRGDADGAFKVLTEALKNSDDPVLKQNHEHLMNNRAKNFSNTNLGDKWFSLMLEEPKISRPRQRMQWR